MNTLPNAPKYSTCWYCLAKIEGSPIKETSVQYSCTNHLPLRIDWHCFRKAPGEWYFHDINIYLHKHFKLTWLIQATSKFWLLEWRNATPTTWGYWDLDNSSHQDFNSDWILSQTPERLLSLLQMYRTFS